MGRPEGLDVSRQCAVCKEDACDDCYDDGFEAGADAMQAWILEKLSHIMRPIHTLLQREELLNNLVSQLRG